MDYPFARIFDRIYDYFLNKSDPVGAAEEGLEYQLSSSFLLRNFHLRLYSKIAEKTGLTGEDDLIEIKSKKSIPARLSTQES